MLRPRRFDVRRAVALAGVAVERELRHAQHLAVVERLVHPAVGIGEDPQRAQLVGQAVGLGLGVVVRNAEQDEQPGADGGDLRALHADGGTRHALHERAHGARVA